MAVFVAHKGKDKRSFFRFASITFYKYKSNKSKKEHFFAPVNIMSSLTFVIK